MSRSAYASGLSLGLALGLVACGGSPLVLQQGAPSDPMNETPSPSPQAPSTPVGAGVGAAVVAQVAGIAPTGSPPSSPADPPSVDGTGLHLDSFQMIEFQYDSLAGHYFYAPQIHVSSVSGTVVVKRLDVTFPDGTLSPPFCSTGMAVTSAGRELVGEIYGDYELTYDYADGHRVSGGSFTLKITYVDGDAQVQTLTATGAIVSGGLPSTYTGGMSSMSPGSC